jgi:uracil-DNA glycosylase family 4
MQFKRPRTKCELCPLKDHKHVYSELVADGSKPKIAILGEAPGREEDRDGKPFTGPSGKLVNWALHECGVTRNNVYVANSICCMPTGQAMDTLEASEALSYCRAGLYDELVAQYDCGLRVLIALGQIAMKQLGLEGKVGTYRGSLMTVVLPGDKKLTVIPTYHPSMVLRMNWKRSNGGTAKGAVEWLADWQKAARIAGEGGAEVKQLRELFELNPTVEQVEEFCNDAIKHDRLVAVDIETSGLGFDACKIVVVGLAIDSERAMCVPFLRENATPYFTNGRWERVKNALKKLFSTCRQVYQNSFFDVPRLRAFGFPIPYKLISHDTMILHHCLAGDTIIDTLDFGKVPISSLAGKKDFYVVSHDGDKLVPKKVKSCWSSGVRSDILRVVFWSKSRPDDPKPWIDCTPEHEFPLQGAEDKVEARSLKVGDRLYRGQYSKTSIGNKEPHRWVYEEMYGKLGNNQVHHIDGNHYNNNPLNLIAVSASEHQSFHEDVRYQANKARVKKQTSVRESKVDVKEVERLYFEAGMSGREVAKYLGASDSIVVSVLRKCGRNLRTKSESNVLRWQKERNCRVIAVVPLATEGIEVFDMEVEDTHNFSANGVIVGNCLAAELPHDLGYIVSVYGRTPYWKDDFKNRTGTIYEMDQIEMRRYNLRDCVVLHQILATMLRDLKELDLEDIYYKEALPLIEPVMEMTQYGVGIDLGRVKRYKVDLEKRVEQGTSELYQLGNLPPEFNVASTSHMRWFLYGEPITAFAKIDERDTKAKEREVIGDSKLTETREKLAKIELAIAVAERDHKSTVALEKRLVAARAALDKRLLPKAQTQIDRDIEALRVVRDTVRPLVVLPGYKPTTTESGLLATDAMATLSMKIALINRRAEVSNFKLKDGTEELKSIDKLLLFLEAMAKLSQVRHYLSTYTNYQPWADQRIHAYWALHGTASGRLSAKAPNLMNLPSIDPKHPSEIGDPIRGFFVSRSGWKFISADYVNLEAQLLAYSTLEPDLVGVFENKLNLHDVNTKAMFNVTETDPMWKPYRDAAKKDFFANKCYGGSDYAIYRKIILEVPEFRMSFKEYADANERWRKAHPLYSAWAAKVRAEVQQRRQARTPFGRVRFFLNNDRDIEKEALNHMIQSSGASLVNRAMVRIERKLRAKGMKTRFVMQVHDELIIEAPDDEVDCAKRILVDEMSRPFEFLGFTRSIPVEAAVGSDLAHL